MSAYAQIDAYPSNGWLRDEKPLCIDSRTWVGRQVNVVSADPSIWRKRFWGFPSGRRPFAGSSVWRRSFYWPFGSADAPLNRMSQQMRYPSRWTSGRCRPAERPLSRLRMATSVRFRSKQPPILTWSPGFWAVFRAVVRYRHCRPGKTLAACGLWGRFRLQNRPKVALKSHPHAATSAVPARRRPKSPVSLKSTMERTTAISVLDLSMGTTLLTSPIESALK